MKINIVYFQQKQDLDERYIKLSSRFATIKQINLYKKNLTQQQIEKAYEQNFNNLKGFSIILEPRGEQMTSMEFSQLFNSSELNFFIGPSFGFCASFVSKFHLKLSLSRLTFTHHLAKTILLEQIYRAFCIKHNHPYNKD